MTNTHKNKAERFFGFLPNLAVKVTAVALAILLLLAIFLAPTINNSYIRAWASQNILWEVLAVLFGLALCALGILVARKGHLKFKMLVLIGTIALLLLQIFIMTHYFFITSWDVGRITFPHDIDSYYYSIYPNNLFIHGLIVRAANFLESSGFVGFVCEFTQNHLPSVYDKIVGFTAQNPGWLPYGINYPILIFTNICAVTAAIVMLANIAKKILGEPTAKIVFVFSAVFTGLMPWILVPYSDTFGLFFTVLMLFAYVKIRNRYAKPCVIVFAAIIGFNIKPTVIFAFMAIVFVELCLWLKNMANKKHLQNSKTRWHRNGFLYAKRGVIFLISIALVGGLSLGFVAKIKNCGIEIDPNKEYTSTHFLMMGLDPIGRGFYTGDLVNISDSAANVEERENVNIEHIKQSLQQLGASGTARLFAEKAALTFADGTFMWKMDNGPNFMFARIIINPTIESIYDNYGPFAQIAWFMILTGAAAVIVFRRTHANKYLAVIIIPTLMLAAFLILFECGARYLILYTPYFILASAFGWKNIASWINCKFLVKNKVPDKGSEKQKN